MRSRGDFTYPCIASVAVELSELRTRVDWVLNPSVMVANALTAFILNLVGDALTMDL